MWINKKQPLLIVFVDDSATAAAFFETTVHQVSMNRDKRSYQLPHIYDYLLSAMPTPGEQQFQRKQQQLPNSQQNNK